MRGACYGKQAGYLVLLALSGACGDSLSDGLQIRGRVGATYGQAARAWATEPGTVDTLVAVPHISGTAYLGGTLTATAEAGKGFELTVDQSYDYVLMLVDTQTADEPIILGYVAMEAGEGTVVNVTTSDASSDVNLGDLQDTGGEVVSGNDLASTFHLTQEEFSTLGRGDDAFKNISNLWLNNDPTTGIWVRPDLNFWFEGSFDDAGSAGTAAYAGASIALTTNYAALVAGFDDACTGALSVELVPPAAVTLGDKTYGPDAPVSNAVMEPGACGSSDLHLQQNPEGIYIAIAGSATTQLPAGWWILKVGGTQIGRFQLDLALPTDASGHPAVPVPSLDLTERAGGVDTAVRWSLWNGTDYTQVADLGLIEKLFAESAIRFLTEDLGGEWQGGWDADPVVTGGAFEGWTLDGSGNTAGQIARTVAVGYLLAGSQVMFSWTGNAICGNGRKEGDEECDGSPLDTCDSLGMFEPGTVTCSSDCKLEWDCPTGAAVSWVSGALAHAPAEHAIMFVDASAGGVGYGMYLGVSVEPDADAVGGRPLWARLDLGAGTAPGVIGLGTGEDGLYSLGQLEVGTSATAWFWVELCPGLTEAQCGAVYDGLSPYSTTASLTLLDKPNGAELVTLPLPDLALFPATQKASAAVASVSLPAQTVLGGLIEQTVAFDVAASSPLGTDTGSPWVVSPTVIPSHPADAMEVVNVALEIRDSLGGPLSTISDDGACTSSAANPASHRGTVYSCGQTTAQVTATTTYRVRDLSLVPRTTSGLFASEDGAGAFLHGDWKLSTVLSWPPVENLSTISELLNSEPSGVFTSSLPSDVGFNATFSTTSNVDVILDAIELTLPAGLSYQPHTGSWQPTDQSSNTWLPEPTIAGNTLTWHGRWRLAAGGGALFNVNTKAEAYGEHTAQLRGYVGDVPIDLTLDGTDDAPATSTVSVSPAP